MQSNEISELQDRLKSLESLPSEVAALRRSLDLMNSSQESLKLEVERSWEETRMLWKENKALHMKVNGIIMTKKVFVQVICFPVHRERWCWQRDASTTQLLN